MPSQRYFDPQAVARLGSLSLVARAIVEGFVSGMHRSPFHGASVEFAEYRRYVSGDDLKHFDWKVFAKTNRRYVRQYEEETNLQALLLVDGSASMDFAGPSAALTKYDYASFLAATLAHFLVRQQDAVGLALIDQDLRRLVAPGSTFSHLRALLSILETEKPAPRTKLGVPLHRLAERLTRKSLIVLISDLNDEPEALIRGLRHLRHDRHEVLVFHVLDSAEIEFPYRDLTDFEDRETGQRLLIAPEVYRARYHERFEAWIAQLRRACAEMRIDYLLADTRTRFDLLLHRYLVKRDRAG